MIIVFVNNVNKLLVGRTLSTVLNVKFSRSFSTKLKTIPKWEGFIGEENTTKWYFLEHKGPLFPPPYKCLPRDVKFYYNSKEIKLSLIAEEVAGFYSRMLDHEYSSNNVFNNNFFNDWKAVMTPKEKDMIQDFNECNFNEIYEYYKKQAKLNSMRIKEEKLSASQESDKIIKEYGYCIINDKQEKVANFKIEPPGLFRGRGEHPKMGKVKSRIQPKDIIINCSEDSIIPRAPLGHNWKEIRHDPSVMWLACWIENVTGKMKYVLTSPSSNLRTKNDINKYETARKLNLLITKIRLNYNNDLISKDLKVQQTAVALYFIDKLALRTGHEKNDEEADTVGCCNLRVQHIQLLKEQVNYFIIFDFLGKDSIRYNNKVSIDKIIFNCLQSFIKDKKPADLLFDHLTPYFLKKHLNQLMEGLTPKVFRTYNASHTLQKQLDQVNDSVRDKILFYNRANKEVAILCNHQKAVAKTYQQNMEKLENKIKELEIFKEEVKRKLTEDNSEKLLLKLKKKQEKLEKQSSKLEFRKNNLIETKNIALGTSKLNYLDPRITVAWCKKNNVPIEKIYSKTELDKFSWALNMTTSEFKFS